MHPHIDLIPALSDNYVFGLHWDGQAAVIDPATSVDVEAWLAEKQLKLVHILITHHHADHTDGNLALKEKWGCPVTGPDDPRVPGLDNVLKEGDTLEVGPFHFQVFETPGHTSSHISLYCPNNRAVFCGDTMFVGGCGRLFEGTPADMYASFQKLLKLPDDTLVYCGHEYTESNLKFAAALAPDNQVVQDRLKEVQDLRKQGKASVPSSIGIERQSNPFATASDAEELGRIRALKDQG